MSRQRPLRGTCACGRNQYIVEVPKDSEQTAQVYFEDSSHHRRHHAAPLTAFLRVPMSWYHSTTYSFYPDETHSAIRRMYSTPSQPSSKRHFCGFCGTPLSYWNEEPASEAGFISLTLGSLAATDLHELESLGLLPPGAVEDAEEEKERIGNLASTQRGEPSRGVPWFESMMEGSRLGSLTRSRRDRSADQKDGVIVEWEIIEWDDAEGLPSTKRKIGEVEEEKLKGDVEMKS
ncbi:MAG: hypothetical protein M1837_007492 [Sclerophora amabilis]|nr:MAG: hypothetical protein M1837_007492 [Sclerophora amabilis]